VDCCVGPSNDRYADNDRRADDNSCSNYNYDRRANNNYDRRDNHDYDYNNNNNHYHYYNDSGSRSNGADCNFGSQRRQFEFGNYFVHRHWQRSDQLCDVVL
jgi:hypothetical protein